jgi:beta-glucosidase
VQHEISPLDGLKARLNGIAEVVYERGYVGDASGEYNGVTTGQDLSESRSAAKLIADAVAAAKTADYVIFIGGLNKSAHQDCEDSDRFSYGLPYNQDAVIEALAEANKNLVVVNISGNAVAMPWVDKVPAIVQDWYLGSEAGNSLADVLVGDVNPSGKLPFTFPVAYEDGPLKTVEQYPGVDQGRTGGVEAYDVPIFEMTYSEGVFVGYRWYDTKNIKPLFAFGHGLSYTTFEFGEAKVNKASMTQDGEVTVTVDVKNTGKVAGAEVVQLYIADHEASVERPTKELKGFSKVYLEPGQAAQVSFTIKKDALSFFDAQKHEWVAEKGKFSALVGSASDKILASVDFELK